MTEPGRLDAAGGRHSFVSLLSDSGVPLEEISRLVGHSGTSVTELVYQHQTVRGAKRRQAMDAILGAADLESWSRA